MRILVLWLLIARLAAAAAKKPGAVVANLNHEKRFRNQTTNIAPFQRPWTFFSSSSHSSNFSHLLNLHFDYNGGYYSSCPFFSEPLQNLLTYYTMTLSIGSPCQRLTALIDTGSSDLWVPTTMCNQHNGFNPLESCTFYECPEECFEIQYVKGYATGLWARDDVCFLNDDICVTNQRFAIATESSDPDMGVFGIGPVNSESSNDLYDNLPTTLVKQGIIAKNLYSIYLDSWETGQGSIVFGGVDLTKFIPPLHTVPLLSTMSFKVALTCLTVGHQHIGYPVGVVLDTGTSLMYLPNEFVDEIACIYGAQWDPKTEQYLISEHMYHMGPDYIEFTISTACIVVPKYELFWPLDWFVGGISNNYQHMALTIQSNDKSLGYNILGDTFLRSAYVVYDLDYRQISIAQSSCNNNWMVQDILPIYEDIPSILKCPS